MHSLPIAGHISTGGPLSFVLGDGGSDFAEGPISIYRNGVKQCVVSPDVAIVDKYFVLTNTGFVFVGAYSGSSSALYMVNTSTCSIKWSSDKNISPKTYDTVDPKFGKNAISFGLVGADEKLLKKRLIVPIGADCVPATVPDKVPVERASVQATNDVPTPHSVGYRWISAYGQGTAIGSITSTDGSANFRIYCAEGQSPADAGIDLSTKGGQPIAKGTHTVQITVGEKTIQVEVDHTEFIALLIQLNLLV